jgi:hypothetical protein
VRSDLIAVAARTAWHGRGQLAMHLPEDWHRKYDWIRGRLRATASGCGLSSPEPRSPLPAGPRWPPAPCCGKDPGQATTL